MKFRPIPITPSPRKRTIWSNCLEFYYSVRDYFAAKRINRDFEQNYEKMVAATALLMLKKQREERMVVDEKLKAMTDILTTSVSHMNEQVSQVTAESMRDMNRQLNEIEQKMKMEMQEHEQLLERLEREESEREATRRNASSSSGSSVSSNSSSASTVAAENINEGEQQAKAMSSIPVVSKIPVKKHLRTTATTSNNNTTTEATSN